MKVFQGMRVWDFQALSGSRVYPLVNQHNYGKSPFLMGKSTISMAIFNSKLLVYQRVYTHFVAVRMPCFLCFRWRPPGRLWPRCQCQPERCRNQYQQRWKVVCVGGGTKKGTIRCYKCYNWWFQQFSIMIKDVDSGFLVLQNAIFRVSCCVDPGSLRVSDLTILTILTTCTLKFVVEPGLPFDWCVSQNWWEQFAGTVLAKASFPGFQSIHWV